MMMETVPHSDLSCQSHVVANQIPVLTFLPILGIKTSYSTGKTAAKYYIYYKNTSNIPQTFFKATGSSYIEDLTTAAAEIRQVNVNISSSSELRTTAVWECVQSAWCLLWEVQLFTYEFKHFVLASVCTHLFPRVHQRRTMTLWTLFLHKREVHQGGNSGLG